MFQLYLFQLKVIQLQLVAEAHNQQPTYQEINAEVPRVLKAVIQFFQQSYQPEVVEVLDKVMVAHLQAVVLVEVLTILQVIKEQAIHLQQIQLKVNQVEQMELVEDHLIQAVVVVELQQQVQLLLLQIQVLEEQVQHLQ